MSHQGNFVNYFKEKRILKEEEKGLRKMLDKFQDQLNRLQIEELALISLGKMQEARSPDPEAQAREQRGDRTNQSVASSELSTSSVIPVGLMIERATDINKASIDLSVRDNISQGLRDEEEEEEEEEEMEEDDTLANQDDQLRMFMDY